MQYLYVASMTGFSGKSLITLGLGLLLKQKGLAIGYIKPYGTTPMHQDDRTIDADAEFMRKALGISEPPEVVSPFVVTAKLQNSLLQGMPSDRFDDVRTAFAAITGKDVVLVGGGADLYEGATFGINSLKLVRHLAARTMIVEPWSGDSSIDSIVGARELLGGNFLGAVINKVPQAAHDHVRNLVRPFLEKNGIPVYASLHRDILLDSITVRQLKDILNGKVLCCEEKIDEFIESYSIGAMDVDSALRYFRRTPNKAVITGTHRSDIQIAALETSTKCLVLTGGICTNEVILSRATKTGTPIISVHEDTYSTVGKIESVLGKIRIREQKKVTKTKEIMDKEFDFDRLVRELQLR